MRRLYRALLSIALLGRLSSCREQIFDSSAVSSAVNCNSSFLIQSTTAADALRSNCSTIGGDVIIGPLTQSTSVQDINLDGVEVIEGTLTTYSCTHDCTSATQYTLSSSTLKRVGGSFTVANLYQANVLNITVPNLRTVGRAFEVGIRADNLTYLDITSLQTVGGIRILAPSLTTLRHTGLRNTTSVVIGPCLINSVDSLFNNPLNISQAEITGPLPNLKDVTVGFTSSSYLEINNALAVTLGGSSTTNMSFGYLKLSNATSLETSSSLESLTADEFRFYSGDSLKTLKVPFDDLRVLDLGTGGSDGNFSALEEIILPPQAVNYSGGFEFSAMLNYRLNLSSVYSTNGKGDHIQTWYWPWNVSRIYIEDVLIDTEFFDTFLSREMAPLNSTPPPSNLTSFSVSPAAGSHFNCTPFHELVQRDLLPSGSICQDEQGESAASTNFVPSLMTLYVVLWGTMLWIV